MLINDFKVVESFAGNGKRYEGHLDINPETGASFVVKDEPTDLQAIIDSYADSCSIAKIIARCSCGDVGALVGNRGEGIYIDEETADLLKHDSVEMNKMLTEKYENLYNNFAGKDELSYDEFVTLISKGNYKALSKFVKEDKGGNDNA